MSKSKKFLSVLVLFLLLGGGLAAAVTLVGQKQLLPKKASTPTGTVNVKLAPETASLSVGGSLPVQVSLIPISGSKSITGMTIKMSYAASGVLANDGTVQPDAGLISAGWSFPIKKFEVSGNMTNVTIGAIYTAGIYTLDSEISVATVTFIGTANGTATVSFDPTSSKLIDASGGSGQDILLTPVSTGTYTVGGGNTPTSTPTPTPTTDPGGDNTPTSTPTPTTGGGGSNPTATPTSRQNAGGGNTPTPRPTIPVAGGIIPTVSILVAGAGLLVMGILLLAL